MQNIQAILFDKDGTLFGFQETWSGWARGMIDRLADGDAARVQRLAHALGYDIDAARFHPSSPVIASTGHEVAQIIVAALPEFELASIEQAIEELSEEARPVEAVPLGPLLRDLRAKGLKLGVATNDFEAVAHAHLQGLTDLFDFIAGFDSGYGGKPEPGMLLGFAEAVGVPPHSVLMVGDSQHDLLAGRAAGMRTLAVLTGVAGPDDLAPFADAVRGDIGHIPELLGLV